MRRLWFLLRLFVNGAWRIVCPFLVVALILFSFLGGLAFADAIHPVQLPAVRPLQYPHVQSRERLSRDELLALANEERWQIMQPALDILDNVCPEIATWTRKKWLDGQLVFDTDSENLYAWYHPATGRVAVTMLGLSECDGEMACTLAHEFRHSRQNFLRGAQCQIALLWGLDRKSELVEDEAYVFEARVRRAIRGIQ